MAIVCLAKISPMNPATGSRVDLYVSSANDRNVTGLNGVVWEPAMTAAPTLSINLWQGDFREPVDTGGASFAIHMGVLKATYANADTYNWAGAPVDIYAEESGTAWPWAARFKGRIASYARRIEVLTINATIDTEPFDKDVLTATYAGTGGAEGSADLKGRLKPLIIGWAANVEPVLINTVDNVYQFSGYGAIEAVTKLYERAADFGASTGDYASYAALVAATIPAGRWATCLAAGMIRLGAPAAGVITGDIKGHKVSSATPRLTGAVINALATIAGVSSGDIETATLTSLDGALAYPINLVLTDQVKWRDMASGLALACNWQSGITLTGKWFAAAVTLSGSEVMTLNAQGAALPQVTTSDEADVSVPYYQTILGANRCWRVQSSDEVSFTADLIPLGRFSEFTTYREGNIVDLSDGSTWIYVNTAPSAGFSPPSWPTTSNSYWSNMTPPTTAEDISYADGTPIEQLKPAEAGATAGAPAGTNVAGTPAEDVIDEQARVALGLTGASFATQQLQDYVDGKIFVEGVPVNTAVLTERSERISGLEAIAEQLDLVAATNGSQTASIISLQTALATPEGASATAIFVLNSNGKVVGWKATNDGTQGILDLLFDAVIIRAPNGQPMFTASGGLVTMPNVKVNTLEVGTAVKPVRAAATSPIVGSGSSSSSGGEGTRFSRLTASVVMTEAGWIEVNAKISQSFTDTTGSPWSLAIRVNGSDLSESLAGGTVPGDVVTTQGAIYLSAGTHTVDLMWAGRNTVTLGARSMFVKGFPFT